jgi:hypothetical protein
MMNNAMRKEDRRAAESCSPVAGDGARNYLHEAIPGEDRLTVRGVPEKTQSAAAADAEHSRTRLQAFPTNAFAAEPLLDSRLADRQGLALPRIRPRRVDTAAARRLIENNHDKRPSMSGGTSEPK